MPLHATLGHRGWEYRMNVSDASVSFDGHHGWKCRWKTLHRQQAATAINQRACTRTSDPRLHSRRRYNVDRSRFWRIAQPLRPRHGCATSVLGTADGDFLHGNTNASKTQPCATGSCSYAEACSSERGNVQVRCRSCWPLLQLRIAECMHPPTLHRDW